MSQTTSHALDALVDVARERDRATVRLQAALLGAANEGIPQREIARALGITQPAVSQMLAAARTRSRVRSGPIGRKLAEHRAEVLDIARAHGASRVRVFGSVARGEENENSDLDLLVSMPAAGLFKIGELSVALSDVLGVEVDILPEEILKRDALPALAATAVPL